MPFVADAREPSTDPVGERLAKFAGPLPHRFVAHSDAAGCAYRLCDPNVVPVETAEPSDWCDAPDCLRGAMERRILVECKVRAHPIVVGGVIRQHMPEVPFPQYHDMVEALASDRANQPFNMTVLPWR